MQGGDSPRRCARAPVLIELDGDFMRWPHFPAK
jgi:hypothetical protein